MKRSAAFETWLKDTFNIDCADMRFGIEGRDIKVQYYCDTDSEGALTVTAMYYAYVEATRQVVSAMRSAIPRIDPTKPTVLDENEHCCEYTMYHDRERVHAVLDRYN